MAISKIINNPILADEITSDMIGPNITLTGGNVGVPVVANDSARNTAIPSPANGMLTYNTSVNALQQYNGAWSTIATPPSITDISGFLNNDNDSTITIFGADFNANSIVKMFNASAGGSQIGSNATTTFNSTTKLTAVFGAGSIGASGSVAYIEIDNLGAVARFATAITVNADPVIALSGNTGTGADTTDHLGTYGGVTAGGAADANTSLLLNFDRGGGLDIEDSSNIGGLGARVYTLNTAHIKSSPFGDGKTAIKFGTDGQTYLTAVSAGSGFTASRLSATTATAVSGTQAFTVEFWIYFTDTADQYPLGPQQIGTNTNNSRDWALGFTSAAPVRFTWNTSITGSWGGEVQWLFPNRKVKTWFHFALVYDVSHASNGLLSAYIDGVKLDYETSAFETAANQAKAQYAIAAQDGASHHHGIGSHGNQALEGYMDEIRYSSIARYSGAKFTVPTARFTSDANTKLLIHSNLSVGGASASDAQTFTDSSGSDHALKSAAAVLTSYATGADAFHSNLASSHVEGVAVAPAMTWPANGKIFGSVGAYLDGNDYLRIGVTNVGASSGTPANLLFAATDNFTIDMWMNTSSAQAAGTGRFYGTVDGSSWANHNAWWIAYYYTGGVGYIHLNQASGNTDSTKRVVVGNLHDSAWHHVAFVRAAAANTSMLIYVDGNYKGTITVTAIFGANNLAVAIGAGDPVGDSGYFTGYLDQVRISKSVGFTGTATTNWGNFAQPTTIYGATSSSVLPTITMTGTTTPALAADEDIEYTSVANTSKAANNQQLTDSGIGLTLTNLTGGNKSKATITGTIASAAGTSHTNMAVKAQVRKTLGNAAYANASRVVTFSSSTTTVGLAPAMPVSGTGIPAGATITSVDSSTTITLSANPTGGTLTGQSLVFLDLTRIAHINGSDTLSNSDAMMSIATGTGGGHVLFNARRYMGTGEAGRQLTDYGFQPDLIWAKERVGTDYPQLHDSVRGTAGGALYSNDTSAQVPSINIIPIIPDGFGITAATAINQETIPQIAWGWKAGGVPSANGKRRENDSPTEISLTVGSISDTTYHTDISLVKQSVNSAGDFSITQYTSGTYNSVHLCHGLSGIPNMVIVKCSSAVKAWPVWHSSFSSTTQNYLMLNAADAIASHAEIWANAGPTATSVRFKDHSYVQGGTFIMYAWKAVAGVSAFGGYTGTAASHDISTGFAARYVMVKRTDSSHGWGVFDSFRGQGKAIFINTPDAENAGLGNALTLSSTGFTINGSDGATNANNGTYIYMAFA